MTDVFFKPWVGKDYLSGGLFGKRIMVLGDSHYCGTPCGKCGENPNPKCNRFTEDVIKAYLDPSAEREGWMSTYLKFERSLVGHETTPEESSGIWNSLLFYNYLQVALSGPRQAGTSEQYKAASEAFFSVMEQYQPDLLVVWGVRLWDNLPSTNWSDGPEISVDGYSVSNGFYHLPSGKTVRALCVYHPSTGYSWDYWHKVIKNYFVKDNTINMETTESKTNREILWEWVDKCLIDNKLSDKEREFLLKKAESLGIDVDEFSIDLDVELAKRAQMISPLVELPEVSEQQYKNKRETTRNKTKEQKKKKRKIGCVSSILSLLVIAVCVALIYGGITRIKQESKPVPFDKYIQENPELIFKSVTFNKYIVKGTASKQNDHLYKLMSFKIKATGYYYIQMKNISKDENKSNDHLRTLYLTYTSDTFFPVSVDVDIHQNDIVEVDNVSPEPLSEQEAEAIAKPVSVIVGGLSALVGAKFGSVLGGTFGKFGKPIGALVGAGAAGGVAGYKTFAMTKNFFWGKEIASSYQFSDEEELLFASKQLMAAELLDMNMESEDDLEVLRDKYEKEIERQISNVMQKFGWKEVHVDYIYNTIK